MKCLGLRVIISCLVLGLAACTSSSGSNRLASDRPVARPIDFDQPTTPQAADKAYPPGDRTSQALQAAAVRDKRVVAAGFDESFNLSRPLFLSSDDGGGTWVRRELDQDSVDRSSTSEGVTDLAAGPAGFVAVGYGYPGTVLWHSPDGVSWRRLPENAKVFPETDSVSAITATTSGFAMIGSSSLGQGRLVYWQSADGTTWRRTDGPPIGLKPTVAGDVGATEIVAHGTTVVISGNLSTPANSKQTDRLQYWYSTNGGRSFRTAAIRGEIASDYRLYNNALAAADGKFVALVQGSGFDDSGDGSWDGVVLEGGPNGASWRVVAKPWVLGSAYEEIPGTLVKAGNDWVATAMMTSGTVDTTVAVGPTWKQFADGTDVDSQRGRGDQVVTDSVAVGNDALLVGSNNRSGSNEPAIWRYRESRVSPIALPAEASAGRASSSVNTLVRAGRELVAVGDVSGAPTGWTRSGSTWPATTLPGRKNGVTIYQRDAAATADGRVVAVGEKSLPIGRRAVVWVRAANGRWTEADSPIFGVQAKSPYGGPSAEAIAIGPSGWVVVGQRHDGDGHFDAWSAYSKDGKTWTEGVGGQVLPVGDDERTRRTRSRNLRSVGTDEAEMRTVLAVGSRFVAGGDRGDGSPAVWLSPNGSDWKTVVKLPLAKGMHSATLRSLGRIGNSLVAIGDYERKDGDAEGGWTSWTSKDGGLTWTAAPAAVPTRAFAGGLVSVPNGLIALGHTGARDDIDAAAWFSRDGRTWTAVPLPGERIKGPGRQGLSSAVPVDGKLLAVAFDVPPYGGGFYTLEIDLPK
ncbi:hypothetical protein EV646_102539 [Kribbella antiqua]|uniref:BNR repeat protein n=1 Tax=Kribbella antiqua TaxID=2512217 RepID=A0A4R2J5J6_9ACTN|nr:hypothetical protein [Kribbella antiqua]TCO50465.1 hypothetical protein EV646_102539 [Kribbella antiqua]